MFTDQAEMSHLCCSAQACLQEVDLPRMHLMPVISAHVLFTTSGASRP